MVTLTRPQCNGITPYPARMTRIPCTSFTRVQERSARTHSPHAACPLTRPSTHELGALCPQRVHRVHERLQLMAARLQPLHTHHHAW